MKNTLLGSLYLALAASIWGGMYVVVKVVVAVIPPLELVWMRYAVAIIALLTIGFVKKLSWRIRRRDILLIITIGIIGNTISIVTQEIGTNLSSAQMGAIITSSTPAFMVIFARLLLKERLDVKKGISVALATIGVLLIVGNGQIDMSNQLGGLSLLIAALTWALMSVLLKRVPGGYSPIVVTTYSILVAIIILTPFVWVNIDEIQFSQLAHPTIWGGLLYLGIISTACAFILWNRGLQMLNASSGGLFFFFQPLVGTLFGWLLLGESLGGTFWIGSILIFIGVLLVIREKK
ncbi:MULTISPECIES: DMT family transporter [Bacillus]|uniref:DMT family transporter n=1 Tax=Bacillus glycinifermentans TaxID=1664069 RepID=A0AAJ3YVD7_9BACI|nr:MULTISPECIES: DMT family transporter [Bacillus]KKB72358.1 membrane protein [Bacillus sp. TH008]MBU8788101.1 DMT family transporter [Bacillus glycinifermentans]MDU0072732.1 DMT family transporter [Bacillus sp. IG6]MED8020491.1 DMT family transporter [Bacillus glycinifermentans]NUJ19018.1 DMT family transporter [Bacillus glycinifermentans]